MYVIMFIYMRIIKYICMTFIVSINHCYASPSHPLVNRVEYHQWKISGLTRGTLEGRPEGH